MISRDKPAPTQQNTSLAAYMRVSDRVSSIQQFQNAELARTRPSPPIVFVDRKIMTIRMIRYRIPPRSRGALNSNPDLDTYASLRFRRY